MSKVSMISGTPWHVEIIRKDEDEQRRHPSRCIYYGENHQCTNGKSPYYILRCGGASRCDFYKENQIIVQEKVDLNLRGCAYDCGQKEKIKKKPVACKKTVRTGKYFCIGYDKGICRNTYSSQYKKVCTDKKDCLDRTSILIGK